MTLAADDPRHGTCYAYNDLRCRCAFCTEAHRTYQRTANEARSSRLGDWNYPQPTHGTVSTYNNWLCRCPKCTLANSNACAEYGRRHPRGGNASARDTAA